MRYQADVEATEGYLADVVAGRRERDLVDAEDLAALLNSLAHRAEPEGEDPECE